MVILITIALGMLIWGIVCYKCYKCDKQELDDWMNGK